MRRILTEADLDALIPPKPVISEAAKKAAQEQYEAESDDDYIRRLYHEQN